MDMIHYYHCIWDADKTYKYISSLRRLPPTHYKMFEVDLLKIRGGGSKAGARCTCFEGGIHESSGSMETKLELGMFPPTNPYQTFRIKSIVGLVI